MVGLSYGVYEVSSAFHSQPQFNPSNDLNRIEALFEASKTMEAKYFWPHLLKQWFQYCAIAFVACGLLLAVAKPPQKRNK